MQSGDETFWWRNMSIFWRVIMGSSTALPVIAVFGYLSTNGGMEFANRAAWVEMVWLPSVEATADLSYDLQASSLVLRDWMRTGDESYREQRSEIWEQIDRRRDELNRNVEVWPNPETVERWNEAQRLLTEVQAGQEWVEANAQGESPHIVAKILAEEVAPKMNSLLALLRGPHGLQQAASGSILTDQRSWIAGEWDAIEESVLKFHTMIPAVMFAGLMMALLVAWITARGIVVPFHKLISATERMASGEAGIELPTGRRDEIGQMAQALQAVKDNMGRRGAQPSGKAGNEDVRQLATELNQVLGRFLGEGRTG